MKILNKSTIGWVVLVFCLLTFGRLDFKEASDRAIHQYSEIDHSWWSATNTWIKATECAREKGIWLAVCEQENVYPISNYQPADDPGHAFLLGVIARLKNRSITMIDVARINLVINLIGFLSVAILLFVSRCQLASIVMMMVGGAVYFSWIDISPHPSLIGVASMAFILPTSMLLSANKNITGTARVFFELTGVALLALAALLREPIGLMGMFATALVACYSIYISTSKCNKLKIFLILVMGVLAWQSPRWLLMSRDAMFNVHKTNLVQTHGFSHNLYIGLGAAGQNKFGIRWEDGAGDEAVKNVAPDVVYVSKEYFRILWGLYVDKVMTDPAEVIRIYLIKFFNILGDSFPQGFPALFLVLTASGLLLKNQYCHRLYKSLHYQAAPIFVLMAVVFICMFVAQGVLAHPSPQYSHPIGGFVLIIFVVGLELLFRLNQSILIINKSK